VGCNHITEFDGLLRNAVGAWENEFRDVEETAQALPNEQREHQQNPRCRGFKRFLVHKSPAYWLMTAPALRMAPMWPRKS